MVINNRGRGGVGVWTCREIGRADRFFFFFFLKKAEYIDDNEHNIMRTNTYFGF